MIWFSDIFHKFPRLSRISTLFLILLVVFPTVFLDGCAFSRHAPDQSARISSGYEPEQTDSVSSESTDNDNQRADSSSANAFDEFLLQLFRSEAALNTINLHFSLSSPESYGITEVPISLGSISSQAANENRAAHGQQAARFCALFLYFPAFHDKIVRIDSTAVNGSQGGFVVFVEKVFFA